MEPLHDHERAELIDLRARLDRAERLAAMGESCGFLAHDLNNILAQITAYAQAATGSPDDTALTKKALTVAIEQCARAEALVQSVLGLVADSGESICDVESCLGQALRSLGSGGVRGLTIDAHVPRGTSVAMRAIDLQQVLVNILLNARRAIKKSGQRGSISIIVGRTTSDDTLVLEISDTGVGMDQLAIARAFGSTESEKYSVDVRDYRGSMRRAGSALIGCKGVERFRGRTRAVSAIRIWDPAEVARELADQRPGAREMAERNAECDERADEIMSAALDSRDETDLAERLGGAGLGLALCRRLVTRAGGTMIASSIVGEGTTVTLRLPRNADARRKAA